jgi:predicted MFS family arabinose efflux permease
LTVTLSNSVDRFAAPLEMLELRAMAAVAFLVFYTNFMVPPLVPAFSHEFGVTPGSLGWLVPGFSIAYGISTLIYGVLSDRAGRSPVLLSLLLFACGTTLTISFAETARELIALRILSGAGTGGIVTISLATIGDRYPFSVQGRPMGWMFGAIAAGMGLGSSLGPILNPVFGWRNEFRALSLGFALIAIVLWRCWCRGGVLHVRSESHPYRKIASEYLRILNSPRGGRTIGFIFGNGVFHGGVFAWLGVLIAERYHFGDLGIGMVLAGYGLPDLLFGGIIGGWGDRYGRKYIVPLGFLWAGACALLLAPAAAPWWGALVITALSLGFEATHPLMSSIATSLDPRHRGQITGLATFAKFLGMGAGAFLFQRLMGYGFGSALVIFAIAEILMGLAALYGFRKEASAGFSPGNSFFS